jgi:hypothetical protein
VYPISISAAPIQTFMRNETQYEIVIEGHLDDAWQGWFDGLELRYLESQSGQPECTVLSLRANDSARLHGVLAQIGALNLALIQVRRVNGHLP